MSEPLRLWSHQAATPFGELFVLTDAENRLRVVDWTDHTNRMQRLLRRQYSDRECVIAAGNGNAPAMLALRAYFTGELSAIDDLEVETGGTAFQREVWRALRRIPCGRTISYAELARQIGRPSAVRAVGLANGANPVGIVVPCHRVIGTNGALTGYGGGLNRKHWLLMHEGAHSNARFCFDPLDEKKRRRPTLS